MTSYKHVRVEGRGARGGGVVWLLISLIVVLFGLVAFNGGAGIFNIHPHHQFERPIAEV